MSETKSTTKQDNRNRSRIPVACVECGIVRLLRTDAVTKRCRKCSARAGGMAPKPTRRLGTWIPCSRCGSLFYRRPSAANQLFCSSLCGNRAKAATAEDKQRKVSARAEANTALLNGRLTRCSCEVCGDPNTQMHHEDYNQPLLITWLCRRHHGALHVARGDLKAKRRQ